MDILVLDSTSKSLRAVLGEGISASPVDFTAHYADVTSTSLTEGNYVTSASSTTNIEILAAPSASTRRVIRNITAYNNDTVSHTVSIMLRETATDYLFVKKTLVAGDSWAFGENDFIIDENNISLFDVTTDNATVSRHGFLPKLSNIATQIMNGLGNWVGLETVVPPSTAGNVMTSNGSAWVSNPPANRNAIINGAMDIWQRGTATLTNPASGTYFPDRFKVFHSLGSGTYNLVKSTETPSENFPFTSSLQHDTTAVETAVAASEFAHIAYVMEGNDFKRFEGNTATLSFWVKAVKTGIYCLAIRNSVPNKSYVHEFVVNSSNTWEKKTVTLTFNSGGTFLYDSGIGLYITWTIMAGSDYQTATPDVWTNTGAFATANQVNGMDNVANNFYLTGVQMELGSVATPFEFRTYAQELALCQRYYERFSGDGTSYGAYVHGHCETTSTAQFTYRLVKKRTIPTFGVSTQTYFDVHTHSNTNTRTTALVAAQASTTTCILTATVAGTPLTLGQGCELLNFEADAGYFEFIAEL